MGAHVLLFIISLALFGVFGLFLSIGAGSLLGLSFHALVYGGGSEELVFGLALGG